VFRFLFAGTEISDSAFSFLFAAPELSDSASSFLLPLSNSRVCIVLFFEHVCAMRAGRRRQVGSDDVAGGMGRPWHIFTVALRGLIGEAARTSGRGLGRSNCRQAG